jgi:hypothetical protein
VIKDNQTGEILKQEEITVAELEIIKVSGTTFICKIVSGSDITEDSLVKPAN